MSLSRFLAAASAALIAISCAFPVVSPSPSPDRAAPASGRLGKTEARILGLINAERLHRGLPALAYNEQLNEMAIIQAKNMARFQKMAHVLPDANLPTLGDRARYVAYPYGRLAENVALGYPDAETVVQGWMNSKGHRANILNSDVAETGIAIARSSAGGLYFCQVFGRRINSL
jgi:uncharacterized protein YkwD